jgi:hypothetical protein
MGPAHLLLLVYASYALINAIGSDRVWILHRAYFGICLAAIAGLLALFLVIRGRLPASATRKSLWYMLFLTLLAVPIPMQERIYPLWVVGDLAVLVAPGALLLFAVLEPELFDDRGIRRMVLILLAVALIAPVFRNVVELGRFRPPEPGLMAGVWVWFFVARGRVARWLGLLTIPLVFALAWASQVRYAPVAFIILGGAAALIFRRLTRLGAMALLGLLGLAAFRVLEPELLQALAEASRFASLLASNLLEVGPLYERMLEGGDVLRHVADGNPVQLALGFGYGATYRPEAFYTLSEQYQAVFWETPEGWRHIVHFGPLRVLLRYGLLGLGVVSALLFVLARDLVRLARRRIDPFADPAFVVASLAMLTYIMRFFLQSVSNDLLFSFFCAAYLYRRIAANRVRQAEVA